MSVVTITLREVRTGVTKLTLTSGGVPVPAGPLTIANGVTQTFTVTAGTDNFLDTGIPGLKTAQRFLGWVLFDSTPLYMSDEVVVYSDYVPWVIPDTMQITLQDVSTYNGVNYASTFTFTLTGDNAPHTLDISAMPMSVVDSPPEITALWRFDKFDPLNPTVPKSDGYRAEYFSWNPIAIDADADTIRVQLMSETTEQLNGAGSGKKPSIRDFMHYIETVTINGGGNVVTALFALWNYVQFGVPVYSNGNIVIKGLPYIDIVIRQGANQIPLFNAWVAGGAYGNSCGCGVDSIVLPNQQGKTFGPLGGGDPHWDLPASKYPALAMAAAQFKLGLEFRAKTQPVVVLNETRQENFALYKRFLAGTATKAELDAALETIYGGLCVFYSTSGQAGGSNGFVGASFLKDPRTGYTLCATDEMHLNDIEGTLVSSKIQLGWDYTRAGATLEAYVSSPFVGNDGRIYAELGNNTVQFIQLFYDTLTGCSALPPNASMYPVGSDIRIDVSNFYPLSITIFTVNGVDHLGDLTAPLDTVNSSPGDIKYLDATHFLTYTIKDALVDQHVVLVAEYQPLNVTPTIPYTVQCHAGCNPAQTWNVSSTPAITAGITIDNTGLINFTLPATVPPETVDIDVTMDDGFSETAERHFSIVIGTAPLFGNVWAAAGHVTGDVISIKVLSGGAILFGTSEGTVYRSTDALQTWGLVDSPGGRACTISEDTSHVIHVYSANNVSHQHRVSADQGATWADGAAIPGANDWLQFLDFGSGNLMIVYSNKSSWISVNVSSDAGTTWTSVLNLAPGLNYWWGDAGKRAGTPGIAVCGSDTSDPLGFLTLPIAGTPATYTSTIAQVGANTMVNIARDHFLNGGWCAVGSDTYGYFSGDDGVTWVRKGAAAGTLTAILAAHNTAIIGGANQFYLSADNCQTIAPAATGTADGNVKCIDRIASNGIMIAGTDGATHNLYRSAS